MIGESTPAQLFKRLSQLKKDIEALYSQASPFVQVSQALKDPLSYQIGGESVMGYGKVMVDPQLPDINDLAIEMKRLQQEHHDITILVRVSLEDSEKNYIMQELESVRRGLTEEG